MPLSRNGWRVSIGLALLMFGFPSFARAEPSIDFEDFRPRDGWLVVDFALRDALDFKKLDTIHRGIPTTVTYEVSLFRARSGWFDKVEASVTVSVSVRFDVVQERYVIQRDGRRELVSNQDEMIRRLLEQKSVPLARLVGLRGSARHYVAVRARLSSVNLQQIQEIEDFLDGKIPGDGAGAGTEEGNGNGVLDVPEKLFGFVASLAGLGDETWEAESIRFLPGALE